MTGVAFPIALSLALLNAGYGYSSLEAFAAGAALCSTSLGTTLAALSSVSNDAAEDVITGGEKDTVKEGLRTGSLPVDADGGHS